MTDSTPKKNVLIVSYEVHDCFKIPPNIDLKNENQVKSYTVKWNELYIELTNGLKVIIHAEGWIHNEDYKYPEKEEIADADNFMFDDDEWPENAVCPCCAGK